MPRGKKLPPVHPGEILLDELQERGISLNQLSQDTRMPLSRVSQIVNRKRTVTADTALRLQYYLGIDAGLWLRIQAQFDLETAEDNADAIRRDVTPSRVRKASGSQADFRNRPGIRGSSEGMRSCRCGVRQAFPGGQIG